MKRILAEHGGEYRQYGYTRVTHILADNLAYGTANPRTALQFGILVIGGRRVYPALTGSV